MVEEVRSGRSLRTVAVEFGVSVSRLPIGLITAAANVSTGWCSET
jgi:hypothetical protein